MPPVAERSPRTAVDVRVAESCSELVLPGWAGTAAAAAAAAVVVAMVLGDVWDGLLAPPP